MLATYAWDNAEDRLLPEPSPPTSPHRPAVKVAAPFVEHDAVFLAAVRHDPDAERAAREVYSQLDRDTPSRQSSGTALKIGPWFSGRAKLLVEGEWVAGGNVFLVHRIVGGSDPPGPPIDVVRERDDRSEPSDEPSPLDPGPPLSRRHALTGPLELTADDSPGRGAGHVHVRDQDFFVINPRPLNVKYVARQPRDRRPSRQGFQEPSRHATGDAVGPDAGVGQARIHATPLRDSDHDLRSMWDALCALVGSLSLDSVEWYAAGGQLESGGPPELLSFWPYLPPDGPRPRWVWLDPPPGPQRTLRGMLVLRCALAGRSGYVVELQRRSDSSGAPTESFSGLVFALRSEAQLDDWLRTLLSRLRDTRGVFARLLSECPGRADDFRHPPSSSMSSSEAAARNALSKLRALLFPEPS